MGEGRQFWSLRGKPRGLSPGGLVHGGSQRLSRFTYGFGTTVPGQPSVYGRGLLTLQSLLILNFLNQHLLVCFVVKKMVANPSSWGLLRGLHALTHTGPSEGRVGII